MDSSTSAKGVSSSNSSAVPKPSPSSGETNENFTNHKNPVTKHFLPSTREKNILRERNEADSSYSPIQRSLTHVAKTNLSNSSSEYSHRSSLPISSQSCTYVPNDDPHKGSHVDDLSLNQYDPLTNYLSPRPKYLRYKPNRRRELVHHLESMGEKDHGLGVERSIFTGTMVSLDDEGSIGNAQCSPLPPQEINGILKKGGGDDGYSLPSQGGDFESEDEAVDSEDEGGEEEYFVDNRWCLNWVFKFLLLTVVVLLSPLFASLMDNPPSSPNQQVGFGDIYHVFGVVSFDVNGSRIASQNKIELSPSSLWQPVDEDIFTGTSNELVDVAEPENMPGEGSDQELEKETTEVDKVDYSEAAEAFAQLPISEPIENIEFSPSSLWQPVDEDIFTGTSNELVEVAEPENMPGEGSDQELEKETTEVDKVDYSEAAEAFAQLPISEPIENKVHSVIEMEKDGFESPKQHEALEGGTDSSNNLRTLDISERLSENENYAKSVIQEEFLEPQMKKDEDKAPGEISDYGKQSGTKDSDVAVNIYSKLQHILLTPAAIAIVSFLSLILAYAYSAKKPRASPEQSKPVVEPPQKSAMFIPIEHQRYTSSLSTPLEISFGVETMATPETKQLPSVYTAEKQSHTKTLEVELLGELVIGGEVSSSLRTCVKKTTEESSYLSSKVSGSKLNPPGKQPSASLESPTSDSSYARLTTEKKLLKKEGGKDGEAKNVITTPVRRSSRIRNRLVSP